MTKKEKNIRETRAIKKLRGLLSHKQGEELRDLWNEYEIGKTREARFVKALDKIETTITLLEFGHRKHDTPELIATYPNEAVRNFPELKGFLSAVKKKLKKEFKKGGFEWKKEYN